MKAEYITVFIRNNAQPRLSTHCSQRERLGRLIEEMRYSSVRLVFVVLLWWVVWCFVTTISDEGLSKVVDNINVREIFFFFSGTSFQ